MIDPETFATVEISLPQYPSSIAISPDGQRLYICGAGETDIGPLKGFIFTIFTIDTSSNQHEE